MLIIVHADGSETMRDGAVIQVPPRLAIPTSDIPLESIRLISVVSKWLGDFKAWPAFVKEFQRMGYNMVHYTPLQERGHSNSPYSIRDHLTLSTDLDCQLKHLNEFVRECQDNGVLSMIDIVWNHISCDSPHLKEHPEIGYNLENSPHLLVAYDLDEGILEFSKEIDGYELSSEDDLASLIKRFAENYLPKLRLWEYFVIDAGKHVAELENCIRNDICRIDPGSARKKIDTQSDYARLADAVKNDKRHRRFSLQIEMKAVHQVYADRIQAIIDAPGEGERSFRLSQLLASFRAVLDALNYERYRAYDERVSKILRNISSRVRYERLDAHGPRLGPISSTCPLVATYFTRVWHDDGRMTAFANNGWIWNADPLVNFAEEPSEAYLLRDVIIWGDCVKLRYGQKPEDSPWLWKYMQTYSTEMAQIFHAFRIDNCHSTPIHVASHLLKVAREVNPELYVCAELFTGSAERDIEFVTSLGLNSLIREAMAAWSVADLGKNMVEYGGLSLGSLQTSNPAVIPSPHALFADCTHDNETPGQRRTPIDALPNAAVVAMSCCAMGSVLGYDLLVPKHINIVKDGRRFNADALSEAGIAPVKRLLHDLHDLMQSEGYTEVFASATDGLLSIIRENPRTRQSYFALLHHAFSWDTPAKDTILEFNDVHLTILFSARLSLKSLKSAGSQVAGEDYFDGIPCRLDMAKGSLLEGLGSIETGATQSENQTPRTVTKLHLNQLQPGTIIVMHRDPDETLKGVLAHLDDKIQLSKSLSLAIANLNLVDLNIALYRCDQEEQDSARPGGAYDVPGHGKLAYCGVAGFIQLAKHVLKTNEMEHPLCRNIREGSWMIDYIINRTANYPQMTPYTEWLKSTLGELVRLPPYLQPGYFCQLIQLAYNGLTAQALRLMGKEESCPFAQQLALGSAQMLGRVLSTGLHPSVDQGASMAAGLPHFTTHHMRVWGRDVFLSFRGLFLSTRRFAEAKQHLVAFAGCLYHGLIPNLLDSGRRPRYNSRDSTWFFLQALQDYYLLAPDGADIMEVQVPMRFNNDAYTDFDDPAIYTQQRPMQSIVEEILRKHAAGIKFTEWNAGDTLDHAMKPEGFVVTAGIDPETGFISGGNAWNCGTWMDKMGESHMAGNVGVPATPRDGSAIELTALLASACRWLGGICKDKLFTLSNGEDITLSQLYRRMKDSFEGAFYIPEDAKHDSALIGRRGIYKDTVGASTSSSDFQFRPNFLTAMVFCPELFDPENARIALKQAEKHLVGPLGMRTLDPGDPNYRPVYSQAESSDYWTSKGFSYHQGPEWLWCTGHYLLARMHFEPETVSMDLVKAHMRHLAGSPYLGLPELTNADGVACAESCQSQAWSMATLLEAVEKIDNM